jgi:hypothetical protein
MEGRAVKYDDVLNFCHTEINKNYDHTFIETAGGVMTPVTDKKTMVNLAEDLKEVYKERVSIFLISTNSKLIVRPPRALALSTNSPRLTTFANSLKPDLLAKLRTMSKSCILTYSLRKNGLINVGSLYSHSKRKKSSAVCRSMKRALKRVKIICIQLSRHA